MAETNFQVSKLTERYSIGRSQVYARLNALKGQNPELCQFQSRGKAWVNPVVLAHLDKMSELIDQGYGTDEAAEMVTSNSITTVEPDSDQTVSTLQLAEVSGGGIVVDENPTINAIKIAAAAEPFGKYKMLDEVAANGWHLPSSELGAILDRKSLSGQEFELYGYKFIRMGKAGSESTWKVEKL